MNHSIAQQIEAMATQEKRATAHRMRFGSPDAQSDSNKRHSKEIKTIILENGWPTSSLVGIQASYDALMLVKNTDDKEFQLHVLELMKNLHKERKDDAVLNDCIKKLMVHLHM